MQAAEALSVLAEVSVAFAGFSGIVTVFRRRDPGQWSRLDRFRFRFMVEFSLATLCLSLAPLLVAELGLSERGTWRVCSVLLGVGAVTYLLRATRRLRVLLAEGEPVARGLMVLSESVGGAIALSAGANAAGLFARASGVYLAGVGGCLFVCSALFARLLLSGPAVEPDAGGPD